MAAVLGPFLVALARQPWVWGESDCAMTVANWVYLKRGVDPAVTWRGTYNDESGCMAALMRDGGVVGCISKGLTSIGLARTSAPVAGDAGIVRAPAWRGDKIVVRATGAICVGRAGWALLTADRGLVIARLPVMRAWTT